MEDKILFAPEDPNRDEVLKIATRYKEKRWKGRLPHDNKKDSGSVTFGLDRFDKFLERIHDYNKTVSPEMQAKDIRVYLCQYKDDEHDLPKRKRVTVSLVAMRRDADGKLHDIIGTDNNNVVRIIALPGFNNGTICPPDRENEEGNDTILTDAGYLL